MESIRCLQRPGNHPVSSEPLPYLSCDLGQIEDEGQELRVLILKAGRSNVYYFAHYKQKNLLLFLLIFFQLLKFTWFSWVLCPWQKKDSLPSTLGWSSVTKHWAQR